ncbi:MAG: hypothetical protein IVW57_13495 [Ktedonobacterales bacterium]|nr:hypothetical protein [Ktedonobacterales bacterium]
MVAMRIEAYDTVKHRSVQLYGESSTTASYGVMVDLSAARAAREWTSMGTFALRLPLPPGMYHQELSAAAGEQMEQLLQHHIGQPTRPASDLPCGDLSRLRRRHR